MQQLAYSPSASQRYLRAKSIACPLLYISVGFWIHLFVSFYFKRYLKAHPTVIAPLSNDDLIGDGLDARDRLLTHLQEEEWLHNTMNRQKITSRYAQLIRISRRPPNTSQYARNLWHPSAYVLEYFRPMYPCFREKRLGPWGMEGAWVCRPHSLDMYSVVYTFGGQSKSMAFESELYRISQPEIHVFSQAFNSTEQVKLGSREAFRFHPNGIADRNYRKFKTLSTIMKTLGHLSLDLLRLDCHGCEFSVMKEVMKEAVVPINQLILTSYLTMDPMKLKQLLTMIEQKGFRMFHREQHWQRMNAMTFSYIHESACNQTIESDPQIRSQ